MSKIMGILKAVAPTVASALGGPMAGLAVHTLGQALGKDGASEDEITDFIIAHQNPEVFLQIKTAETQLKREAQRLGLEVERLNLQRDSLTFTDRISARDMASRTKSRATAIIAAIIIVGFAGIIVTLFAFEIPESSQAVLYLLIGSLAAALTQVMNFYFGSSSGSKMKDEHIRQLVGGMQSIRSELVPPKRPIVDVEIDHLETAKVNPANG